ncbi:eukaryotic translation initiation factor 4E [Phakopsora pachyrhizi]|uniref:Eukaryotic translation initiation factor 4E n=1 Tax=Phakopsora pachyrhizi TaxID=170000 RepID=A0AAV0BUD0_PHAPC|nr:eukaryotic translation initiation factor 4E [Phakopsora pachyrhizi]CAH7689264.1 eukaryotic translation initiation factor 4E [Phakopsora pachyrhizi]
MADSNINSNNPTVLISSHSQLPSQAALASSRAVQAAITELSSSSSSSSSSSPSSSSTANPIDRQTRTNNPSIDTTSSNLEQLTTSDPTNPQPPNNDLTTSNTTGQSDEGNEKVSQLDPKKDDLITIFSSQTDFNVKHPLYSPWTLWFDNATKNDKAKNWEDLIQKVMEVESVEEFWGLYHNIVPPSLIHVGSTYYLFKEGIKPAWEDESNQNGGRWSVQLPRDKNRDLIDKWWLYTMLTAIGETFETPYTSIGKPAPEMSFTNEVTGVIVSSRRSFFRLSIWTRTADNRPKAENIGRHFKYGVLGMSQGGKRGAGSGGGIQTDCEFQSHADSQKKKRGGWTGQFFFFFF